MKKRVKKPRRAGATETFSVSVDPETKRALRALADQKFDGNLSALITNFGEEAQRRLAVAAYLRRLGLKRATREEAVSLQAEIAAEVAAWHTRSRRRRVA